MITQLTQEAIAEYASDAQTIDEPVGVDYSQGVKVGRTVPAKWWNWLFSAVTKRAGQSKSDAQNMLTELQNVVTDAGMALNPNDSTQLSQAIGAKTSTQITDYVDDKRGLCTDWVLNPDYPTNPSGYLSNNKFVDGCYVRSTYQNDSSGGIRNWSFQTSPDMRNWGPQNSLGFSVGIDYKYSVVKFRDKYFLLAQITTSPSSQQYLHARLYSSDDALNWTLLDSWQLYDNLGKSHSYGVLFTTETRIGVVAMEQRTSGSTSSDITLRTSVDGTTFNKVVLSGDTANYYGGAKLAANVAKGYDYTDGFILGNCTVSNANVVTRLFNIGFSARPASWAPGLVVYKLASNVFVFADNTYDAPIGMAGTKWHTAPVTGNAPVVTERTGQACRAWMSLMNNTYIFRQLDDSTQYLQYSTDGVTFTDLGVPASSIYELDGVFYAAQYKSTDLTHWTEMEHSVNGVVPEIGILTGGLYVSKDAGVSWDTSNLSISGDGIFKAGDVFAYNNYLTFSLINRVIGHTLYLR